MWSIGTIKKKSFSGMAFCVKEKKYIWDSRTHFKKRDRSDLIEESREQPKDDGEHDNGSRKSLKETLSFRNLRSCEKTTKVSYHTIV